MKIKAKMNLILKVLNKNDLEYHNLQMINTRINFCDIIKIKKTKNKDEVIYINHPEYQKENDLILVVLNKFKEKYNILTNYQIKIFKYIPFGAGLGGVSMDIGYIIKKINIIEKLNLTTDELIKFLTPFGADIPYGLYDKTCLVEGIGEKITKVKYQKETLILIYPNIYINTKDVFNTFDKIDKVESSSNIIDDLNNHNYYNELQNATYLCEPKLKTVIDDISKYGTVIMSGTGSTLFLDTSLNKKKVVSKLKHDYPLYIIKIIKTTEGEK